MAQSPTARPGASATNPRGLSRQSQPQQSRQQESRQRLASRFLEWAIWKSLPRVMEEGASSAMAPGSPREPVQHSKEKNWQVCHSPWVLLGVIFWHAIPTENTFSLTSSKGICTFQNDILTCGPHINNPIEFEVSPGNHFFFFPLSHFKSLFPIVDWGQTRL